MKRRNEEPSADAYRINPTRHPRESVRIWVYHRGWVRLTVKRGGKLYAWRGGDHEEGYNCTEEAWRFDGRNLYLHVYSHGRDCDGRHSHTADYRATHLLPFCPAETLPHGGKADEMPGDRPEWQIIDSRHWDQFAELAGY